MADWGGVDAVHVHTGNSTNVPGEVLETSYPLRCTHYSLVEGAGGAGQFVGGMGIAREIEALEDGTGMTLRSDGHLYPAPGAAGGGDGSVTRAVLTRVTGEVEVLPSKSTREMQAGDRLLVETLGGAGYGPPDARAPKALAADLRDGRLDEEAARAVYGNPAVTAALGRE